MWISWLGFLIAIAVVLVGARYHLTLSLLASAIILGLFTLTPHELLGQFYATSTSADTLILILALGIIPVIGGILQVSGKLDDIIGNLRVGRRMFLGTTPALLGLLPIPGGALFSAPLVDKAGVGVDENLKTGINVWFRHVLYFVYPISYALIVPAGLANLSIYRIILFQIPIFIMLVALGYFFLLRKVDGELEYDSELDLRKLILPLLVLIAAPVLHFVLYYTYEFSMENISLLMAVTLSLVLAIAIIGDSKVDTIKSAIIEMKPWNFMLLIFFLYLFIGVFLSSGVGELIEGLAMPRIVLIIGMGFLLGLATGRIIVPATIIIPIYMETYGLATLPILVFSLMYLSVFMGYVLSPVHPCISISLKYFKGKTHDFIKIMAPMVVISLSVAACLFLLFV